MTREEQLGWLASIIDGEGNVCFLAKSLTREICISNTDEDIVLALGEVLRSLDVHFTVSVDKPRGECQKPCYRVVLSTRDALVFIYENCPLQCRRKKDTLLDILLSYKRRPYAHPARPYTDLVH